MYFLVKKGLPAKPCTRPQVCEEESWKEGKGTPRSSGWSAANKNVWLLTLVVTQQSQSLWAKFAPKLAGVEREKQHHFY